MSDRPAILSNTGNKVSAVRASGAGEMGGFFGTEVSSRQDEWQL